MATQGLCVCVCVLLTLLTSGRETFASSSSHLPPLHFFPTLSSRPTPEQARRELRRLKEEARRKNAVAVIWAYWQGLKVPTSPTARPSSQSVPPTPHL